MSEQNNIIKSSIEQIEPADGARERMLANIKRKAAEQTAEQTEPTANPQKAKILPVRRFLNWALPIAACFVIAIAGTALLSNRQTPSDTQESVLTGPGVELANPFQPVENAAAFKERLGIELNAPEGAENTEYTIIDGELADIWFEYRDHAYTLRASRQSGDFSGLNGISAGTEQIDAKTDAALETIRSGDEFYRKITWTDGAVTFILINTDGADAETMKQLYDAVK